jgi:Enoyl-CoA hydratase/isomerase
MEDILTEHSGSILRVQLNRPGRRNAMTSGMYLSLASIFSEALNNANTRVVLWHGAGDSFCAGNDIEDFLKNPPGPGESPQARLMEALVRFDKPLVAAVHGAAIGGGTTMLTHCDFIYAGESTKFQMPFINLAVVPNSDRAVPCRRGSVISVRLSCFCWELPLMAGALRSWVWLPTSYPTRMSWRGRRKRLRNWQRSRRQRCEPAKGS